MNLNQLLGQEWMTLQNNHEHYERGAWASKVATGFFASALLSLLVVSGVR